MINIIFDFLRTLD